MAYIIQGLYFGLPTKHKGDLYLMMYPYHWLVTSRTPYYKNIRVGSIVKIPNNNNNSPVYVLHRDSHKQTNEIGKYLISKGHPVKTVTSGKITKKIKKNNYVLLPNKDRLQKVSGILGKLVNAYRRLIKKHKVPAKTKPLDRMIYVSKRHYKFLPCAKKYAWWLKN